MKGICKLCKREKNLLKKSHIIPNFLYKELYDKQHKINILDIFSKDEIKKPIRPSTGEYEQFILCSECDNNIIGRYESYCSIIIQNKDNKIKNKIIINNKGNRFNEISNIDYTKTKLFLLSLLWRMSISSRDIYKDVNLESWEEQIRNQIIDDNPKKDNNIPIIILSWKNDKKMARDIITQPSKYYNDSKKITFYSLIVSGYIILFYLTDDLSALGEEKHFRLKEENSVTIIYLEKGTAWDFILRNAGYK